MIKKVLKIIGGYFEYKKGYKKSCHSFKKEWKRIGRIGRKKQKTLIYQRFK